MKTVPNCRRLPDRANASGVTLAAMAFNLCGCSRGGGTIRSAASKNTT